jgi:hypothetical protein
MLSLYVIVYVHVTVAAVGDSVSADTIVHVLSSSSDATMANTCVLHAAIATCLRIA